MYLTVNSVTNFHNQCVQKCKGSFGDNITLSCVVFCPTPSIADPTTSLCVDVCPQKYYFQISTNGNRTCVQTCEDGQWLNPYFLNCSNNPLNCPFGTYADNNTHKCEKQCTLFGQVGENTTQMCQTVCNTGFADWYVGLCVATCNNTMFGYVANKECVFSCNTSIGLYGDVQAGRRCVQTCSSTPVSTFGDNSTKLC